MCCVAARCPMAPCDIRTGYGSRSQAEVYRTPLKMVRRKKGETLTDLAPEIRRLLVMAFQEPADRTTDIVARDLSVQALENSDLAIQIQAPG